MHVHMEGRTFVILEVRKCVLPYSTETVIIAWAFSVTRQVYILTTTVTIPLIAEMFSFTIPENIKKYLI